MLFEKIENAKLAFKEKEKTIVRTRRKLEETEKRLESFSSMPGFVEYEKFNTQKYSCYGKVAATAYFNELSSRILSEIEDDFWTTSSIDKKQGGPGTYRIRVSIDTRE